MKIGELFMELGFHADTMKLKDFGRAVADLNMTSILSAGSFGVLYEGAKKIIDMADDLGEGILKFGRETGQSTQEIQKWSTMAKEMGVSADVVATSVSGLEDRIFRMRITGEGSNIWAMLGLDPRKTNDMFSVLTMLREKLKNLSTEQQRFFLEQLGLSTEMLNIFKLTDEQWKDIPRQQALSNQELDKIQQYNTAIAKTSRDFQIIWADIAVTMLPAIDAFLKVSDSIATMARNSRDFKGIIDLLVTSARGWSLIIEKTAEGWGYIFRIMSAIGLATVKATGATGAAFSQIANPLVAQEFGIVPPTATLSHAIPNVNLIVKNTIKSNDHNTTVETTSDHGDLNSTVRNIVNQKPAGQS